MLVDALRRLRTGPRLTIMAVHKSSDRGREPSPEQRCADRQPCFEVTSRLAAAEQARLTGIGTEDAVHRILQQAERIADAHGHGTDRRQP